MANEDSTIFHNHNLGETSETIAKQDFDFVGFRFGGIHSSDLGIKHVSDGSRYNEDLLPSLQDKTVQIPGGDGTYYFGSYYTQRSIPVSIAFDDMTETQFRELRFLISKKEPQELIFDERPYKKYMAKISPSAQSLKYICFEKEDGQRRYCGEGNLNFICYFPFARATHWKLDGFEKDWEKRNIDQWKEASRLPENDDLKYNGFTFTDGKGCSQWRFAYLSNYDSEDKRIYKHMFFRLVDSGDIEEGIKITIKVPEKTTTLNFSLISAIENFSPITKEVQKIDEEGKVSTETVITGYNESIAGEKTLGTFTLSLTASDTSKILKSGSRYIVIDGNKNIIYPRGTPNVILSNPSLGEFFKIPPISPNLVNGGNAYWLKIESDTGFGASGVTEINGKQKSKIVSDSDDEKIDLSYLYI